jgi:hypothetical protein
MPIFCFVKYFGVHLSFFSRIFHVCFPLKISIHLVLEIGHVHKEGNAEATVKLFSFSTKYHIRVKYFLKDQGYHIYSLQFKKKKKSCILFSPSMMLSNKHLNTWKISSKISACFESRKNLQRFQMYTKIQQTKIPVKKNLALSSNHNTCNKGRLKVISLPQVGSYDFEPTFIICFVIIRVLPDQPK